MKTIILPTDFSKNANHATNYGVQLARYLGCKALLMHSYEPPMSLSEYGTTTVHFYTVRDQIIKRLEKDKNSLLKKYGSEVNIDAVVFNDDLVGHLTELYKQPDTFLIVIGLTGAGMANFFLGSNTLNIVNKVGRAVLTIPPFTPFKPVKKIVFAFDLWNVAGTLPIKRIKRIREKLNAELLILNLVSQDQKSKEEWIAEKERLEVEMTGIPYSFHTISGKRVVDAVNKFAREQSADMLAIIPHEKGFIENLLNENHTKSLLFRSGIPILTLPPDKG